METKDKFIHRDLSWLEFNRRVLEEAADERNPLLERIKFLAIFTSNLDEFFMVRMSGAKKLLTSGYNKRDQFGFYPQELFAEIKSHTDTLVERFYEVYGGQIRDALESQKIFIKKTADLNSEQKKYVQRFLIPPCILLLLPWPWTKGILFLCCPRVPLLLRSALSARRKTIWPLYRSLHLFLVY